MSLLKAMLMGGAVRQDSFKVVTYIGTGAERAITGVGFQPDFVWIKNRDAVDSHKLIDSVRGVTKAISSDTTGVEVTEANGLKSFDEDGFTVGTDVSYNTVGEKYVVWCWKADNAGVTDATQEEQYNASAGLSIIKYTGDGVAGRTLSHSLGRVPKMVIVKKLNSDQQWVVYNTETTATDYLVLNTTAQSQATIVVWDNTEPTFDEVSLGTYTNASGDNYVAYCFAEVPNVSSIGSYTGTGAVDNVVNFGFQPAYLMIKRTDVAGSWILLDNKRDTHNPNTAYLEADTSDVETTGMDTDFTSTGFEIQSTDIAVNASAGDYIYMAFAELPQESSPENRDEPLFGQIAYTGDGALGHSIDGLNFKPDLLWFKNRDAARSHQLFDIVRGVGLAIASDATAAELSDLNTLMAFDADGFTVGADLKVNAAAGEYIAWAWNAGGEAVPSEDGSIGSTVMANVDGGFSIVKYAGNATAGATIGHGLDAVPEIIIVKDLDAVNSWRVYSAELANTTHLILNDTNAVVTGTHFNDTTPTSSVFTIGVNDSVNGSGKEYIAYCWTSKSGVSDFSSYTGTGAAGKTVTLGFKPDMLVIKRTDVANNWGMYDSRRNTLNPVDTVLYPNVANVEGTGHDIDFTDTGFELNNGDAAYNASGGNYIYMAFKVTEDPDTLHQVETGDLQLGDSLTDDNGTHTISVSGDTQLSTVEVACGTHSILFDGSGDLLSAPDHDDWNFGAGDLTVDVWVNMVFTTDVQYLAGQYEDVNNFWYLAYHIATGLIFKKVSGGVTLECISPITIDTAVWRHIAAAKDVNGVRLYLSGQEQLLGTNNNPTVAMPDVSAILTIGYISTTFFQGYMDHIRIVKGAALWTTTNFNLSDKGLYYPSGTLQI